MLTATTRTAPTVPTTMPATAPEDSPWLWLAVADDGEGRGGSGWSGSSVTWLPLTPQPDMLPSTMSSGLACRTWQAEAGRQ